MRPDHPVYPRQVVDHLGLVAGMFAALGRGDVIDQATHPNPELRDLTAGEAVKAMVLNGLGLIQQALDLGPRFFQHKPTSRLRAPRVAPHRLNDDALGRAFETRSADGVTARDRLMAVSAAKRLGLTPTSTHLDTTSVHGDGRDNSDAEPPAPVVHLTQGDRREHRPDLNQGMVARMVEPQAGMPVLMPPRRGKSSAGKAFGPMVRAPRARWHTTYGTTYRVADSARSRDDHLQRLAETHRTWMTRVPAT